MLNALTALVLLVPVPQTKKTAQPKKVPDLSGYYSCEGKDKGKAYSGVALIVRTGDVYTVQWVIGASQFVGVGMHRADRLVVGWARGGANSQRGVNSYRIDPGPRLVGEWAALPGDGRLHSEILTFLRPLKKR